MLYIVNRGMSVENLNSSDYFNDEHAVKLL
jgi:hypothetical protein